MEISGKIIKVLPARGGVSQRTGNKWMTQEYVIETHEQYPKHCVFNIFGEDRIKEFAIKEGEELTVSFDIDAREYNGRWFNDIRAWRVERGQAPTAAGQAPTPAAAAPSPAAPAPAAPAPQAPAAEGGTADDLPF